MVQLVWEPQTQLIGQGHGILIWATKRAISISGDAYVMGGWQGIDINEKGCEGTSVSVSGTAEVVGWYGYGIRFWKSRL